MKAYIGGLNEKDWEERDEPFMTYRVLREMLKQLTEEQLDQVMQIMPPNPTPEPTRLQPVIGINTLGYYGVDDTRSVMDFEHHPEQIVLLSDYSPFSKEGDTCYTMEEGGMMRGNKTGKLYKFGEEN